jgi:hypothetical protein
MYCKVAKSTFSKSRVLINILTLEYPTRVWRSLRQTHLAVLEPLAAVPPVLLPVPKHLSALSALVVAGQGHAAHV